MREGYRNARGGKGSITHARGLCKKYLKQLESMRSRFEEAGIAVFALSADHGAKAEAQVREGELGFEVGYDLQVEQMRELGLYVSPPTD